MEKSVLLQKLSIITLKIIPGIRPEQIVPEVSLKDLGANSIDRMEIVTDLMEELDIVLHPAALGKIKDIGELIELLHQNTCPS